MNTPMERSKPTLHVSAAFAALFAMIFIAWHLGYASGLRTAGSLPPGMQNLEPIAESVAVGTVQEIESGIITLATLAAGPDRPSAVAAVRTSGRTTFEKTSPKAEATFLEELADFNAAIQKSGATASAKPPLPYTTERIALSDIQKGDVVVVTYEEEFSGEGVMAATVTVQHAPFNAAARSAAAPSTE